MRHIILIILSVSIPFHLFPKPGNIDSLLTALSNASADSTKIKIYNQLILSYAFEDPQKSIDLGTEIIPLLKKAGNDFDQAYFYKFTGIAYYIKGDYVKSLNSYIKALNLFEKNQDILNTARVTNNIGIIFDEIRNYSKAMEYYTRSLKIYENKNDNNALAGIQNNIGMVYYHLEKYDSALIFLYNTLDIAKRNNLKDREADAHLNIGSALVKKEEFKRALDHLLIAYKLDTDNKNTLGIIETQAALAESYLGLNQLPEAYKYLRSGLQLSQEKGTRELTSRIYEDLALYYETSHQYELALQYIRKHLFLSDSILNSETRKQIENIRLLNENEQKAHEIGLLTEINNLKDSQINSQKNRFALLFIIVMFLIIICVLLWIYYQIKSRANKMLAQNNRKISEQNAELEFKTNKLLELSTEKDNMVGVVAHDLKSPLNKIMGLSGLIKMSGDLRKEQVEYFNLMERVIADANHLIARILDINKLESVGYSPNNSKVNLSSVMEDVADAFRKPAEEKEIKIHLNCDKDLECITDREMISRILDNLISNAIKFSEKNKNIFMRCIKNNGHIKLSIKDEGPGIKKDEIPLLFRKYTRLSAQPTAGESSTGLGLAIVHLIVSKLNGKIEVHSEDKTGTEFIINIPVEK